MIDLHSHVLPHLDDGAQSIAEAVAMCRAAIADGTTILAATPHVRQDYPTTPDAIAVALNALCAEVERLPIEILGGGELALDQLRRPVEELRAFGLAGNPDYLLVETPYFGWPTRLVGELRRLRGSGIVPILAHPERSPAVQAAPNLLADVVGAGALVQVTAGSVDGRLGRRAQKTALRLVAAGWVQLLASDAHGPSTRTIGLTAAARALGDPALARWLTYEIPNAIVRGAPLPPRPAGPTAPA